MFYVCIASNFSVPSMRICILCSIRTSRYILFASQRHWFYDFFFFFLFHFRHSVVREVGIYARKTSEWEANFVAVNIHKIELILEKFAGEMENRGRETEIDKKEQHKNIPNANPKSTNTRCRNMFSRVSLFISLLFFFIKILSNRLRRRSRIVQCSMFMHNMLCWHTIYPSRWCANMHVYEMYTFLGI